MLFFASQAVAQQLGDCQHSKTVHAPKRTGQLIDVPAALGNQRAVDQINRMSDRDTKPEIIILADWKRFVESACQIEKFFGHHHRRWTDQTKLQTALKNVPAGLSVPHFGINSHAIANPDFLGLANLHLRILFHEISLNR